MDLFQKLIPLTSTKYVKSKKESKSKNRQVKGFKNLLLITFSKKLKLNQQMKLLMSLKLSQLLVKEEERREIKLIMSLELNRLSN